MKTTARLVSSTKIPVLLSLCAAVLIGTAQRAAWGTQNPPGCSANNLVVNIAVNANNVTNGSIVTWKVTVWNPPDASSCDITLGPSGLYFTCPGGNGLPTGAVTTLIPGGTTLPPGYGPTNFFIPCLVLITNGAQSAIGEVSAPGAVVHKNPLRDDPADVDKTISVNVFRPCISTTARCLTAVNATGSQVVVTYTGTVTNCGDIFLQNVVVVSDQPAPGTVVFGPVILQAGTGQAFTVSYTNSVNLCGPFAQNLMASGEAPLDVPDVVTASAASQCSIGYNPAIHVTKVCPAEPVQPGGLLNFSGIVSNAGNIVLTNVMVFNNVPAPNTPLLPAPVTLAVGASVAYSGAYVVPVDSCPPYTSTVSALGTSVCGAQTVNDSTTVSCPGANTPAIQVTKTCPPLPVAPGGTLTYSGTVTNTGNITLTNVIVLSDQPVAGTRVFGPVTLAPGVGAAFTGSYTVAADSCGPYVSTLTASGRDKCFGALASNSQTVACPGVTTPGIAVTKTCPAAPVQPGGTLTYSGTVRNTGNITLTNVTVMNVDRNKQIYGPATLTPGATANFTDSYVVPLDSCGPYTDTLTAQGLSACGVVAQGSVTVSCPGTNSPALRVTRACPADPVQPGGLLVYMGSVTNTGNVTLTNVVVNSAQTPGAPVFGPINLAPGAGVTFPGSYTVPLDSCGPYTDTLTASGADQCFGKIVSNAVSSSCPGTNAPAIAILQQCPEIPTPLGQQLTFTATVINTGNITLTNIVVINNRPASNTVVFTAVSLAPGQSTNFTGRFTVPSNLNACSITNTLNVTARNKCGGTGAASAVTTVCTVVSSPSIHVAQRCPATPAVPGGTLVFTGAVTNTGNTTLTGVSVVVDQPAPNTVVFTTNSLPPGGWAVFTGSYPTPLDTCSATATLVASGTETCGTVVADSVTTTCPLATSPGLGISRICPNAPVAPGDQMALFGWITNRGNITLTNVTIVVDQPVANTVFYGPVTLAPGQVAGYEGSFTVPTNATGCTFSSTVTVRGNDKCVGTAVSSAVTTSCTLLTRPGISVTKSCPPAAVPPGGTLVYTATVTNTGNVTLNNITVLINQPATNTLVRRIASLLPGTDTNFTGSYVVPGDSCTVCATIIASGADACTGSNVVDTASTVCPVLFTPRITLSKTCPTAPTAVGSPLVYSGMVSNAGNVTLTGVVIYNDVQGAANPVLGVAALAPGEVQVYTSTYTVPNDFCGTDTVTVEAESICGGALKQQVTSTCPILTTPGIAVTRLGPVQPVPRGGLAVFNASVFNIGNVTLTNVVVVDNEPALNTVVFHADTLAPGQSANFTYSYTPACGCCCCQWTETLTARGQDRCASRTVSNTSTIVVPLVTHPSILVAVDCPASGGNLGDTVAYSGTVMNNGDVNLTNVVILSNEPGPSTQVFGPVTLAPGETQIFAATYVVTANTPPLSSLVVTASGLNACSGVAVLSQDNCAGNLIPSPVLSAPKTGDGQVTLSWSAKIGHIYRVQSTTSLRSGVWVDEPGDITAQATVATKSVAMGSATQKFYRIVVVQ